MFVSNNKYSSCYTVTDSTPCELGVDLIGKDSKPSHALPSIYTTTDNNNDDNQNNYNQNNNEN